MSPEWLRLETGKTVTTLRFLSTHLDLVEAKKLQKRLYDEAQFLEHRIRGRENSLHITDSCSNIAETAKVS